MSRNFPENNMSADSLNDYLNVGICKADMNGNILYANRKMLEILEIPAVTPGLNLNTFLPVPFINIRKLADGKEKNLAIILNGKMGKQVLATFCPLPAEADQTEIVVSTFIDLSTRKTSHTENIYKEIFHNGSRPQAVSLNFYFTEVNDAYCKLYGYSREELIGMPVFRLLTEKSQKEVIQIKIKKDQGEPIGQFYEVEGLRKDGTIVPLELELNFLSLSGGESVFFSAKDISLEKAANEALVASEAKFRSVFSASMIGISLTNPNYEIVDVNQQFLKTIGYTWEDFRNKAFDWTSLTPPEYYETDKKAAAEFLRTGNISPYEKEFYRKDGTTVPVLVAASQLEHNHLGVGFLIDLSEIKNIKKETEKLTKELSTYIYMASHDLKGPLASVIGLTTVAKAEIKESVALEYLDLIRKSTLKLDKSLVNLMKIMKIKNNQLDIVPIDFSNMVGEVLENLKYMENFSRCSIHTSFNIQRPFFSDPDLLQSVFQNLIENSVKYQNPFIPPVIHIEVKDTESELLIKVMDNGKGIDEKIKDRIFDMFFRGTLESKGSGLGLYIVKSAAEQLQGSIDANNRHTGGVEFTLSLPRICQPAALVY